MTIKQLVELAKLLKAKHLSYSRRCDELNKILDSNFPSAQSWNTAHRICEQVWQFGEASGWKLEATIN